MVRVATPADLGALAHASRTARGWSQQQAADAAGVSRRFVNMLEGGWHANAEVWRVLALLDALGVQIRGTLPAGVSDPAQAAPATTREAEPGAPDGFDLDAHLSAFRDDRGRS